MPNFLKETENDISQAKRHPSDIAFIGSCQSDYRCSWTEFKRLADFDYDNDPSALKIPVDIIVSFRDGAKMVRRQIGLIDRWVFCYPEKGSATPGPIRSLKSPAGLVGATLAEIQEAFS